MTTQHEWDGVTIRDTDLPHPTMERPDEFSNRDYEGIAQLDKDVTTLTPWLHDIIGLDRDRWSIVGINASPHSGKALTLGKERDDLVRIYAVDRERASETHRQPGGFYNDEEDIEVVEFLLHDLTLEDLFKAFKTVRLSFVSKGIDPARIKVAGLADIPIQPDPGF